MEINFPKTEKKILKFWKETRAFEKSVEQRAPRQRGEAKDERKLIAGRKKAVNFVFYEGPPTVNAKAGMHSILARVYKDIICRYKTMQGFKVLRKAGWDTHGLPVELEIEKKLGLKNKKEIEKYGVAVFNQKCRESVWAYKGDWEKLTERIGYWLDMENPYITSQTDYIETVWEILKQIWQKGLLYQDYKVVPYCPRCETSLSSHEVALGYKKIKEPAIYVKLKVKNEKLNTYLLVWTTTPWTLPGNIAVAVNPKFDYVKVKISDGYLILAKERLDACGIKGKIIKEFKGKSLLNLEYEPLYEVKKEEFSANFYRVIAGEFVSSKEGTGLVHIAPAFGEEDMAAAKQQFAISSDFQFPRPVDGQGRMIASGYNWNEMFVKAADPLIIENLRNRKLLFKEELYEHDYPFCWRCRSHLLYYAKQAWFINMQKVKEDLIKNNQKINWIPAHLKEGRFGEWLREIKDWAFSRERYWGTPLPIWQCKKCGNLKIIGSKEEMLAQKFSKNNYYILRHGHSKRQIKNLANCWPEKDLYPLTKKGEKQIEESAKKLKRKKIDIIFSSDLQRTKQTAKIVSKETKAKIIFDKKLREYNVGIFNGKDPKLAWEHLNKSKNVILTKLPKGESLMELRKRMYAFLKGVDEKYQNKNILIVSHELPLTIFKGTLKGLPIEKILTLRKLAKESKIQTGEWQKVEFKTLPYNEKMELDFHRPYVDEVKFYCSKCGDLMERMPEVIDCWLDSGSMPFAKAHWPFAKQPISKPPELFPADYISEAVDQTRGWFYTLLSISTLLGFGAPYKNVISLGHVLDRKGEKMSKSKGNVVDPWMICDKYGADAVRWHFFTMNQPGDPKLFQEKEIEQVLKKFIMTFWNSYLFFETYGLKSKTENSKNLLDRWIVSKLNELIQQVAEKLDNYDITSAARAIENFVIEDFSLWYIRRSRKRFQRPKTQQELKQASIVLGSVLLFLSKLTSPFIPFLSEEIHQRLLFKDFRQSVHLADFPKVNKKLIDKRLEEKMKKVREIVALALAKRAAAGIKVRQPLNELRIANYELKKEKELLELIKEEINVKKITFGKGMKLDVKITSELKEEGIIREVIRQIQEMRKKAGYKPRHKISTRYSGTPNLNKLLDKNKNFIQKEAKIKSFQIGDRPKRVFDIEREIKIDAQILWLGIRKI